MAGLCRSIIENVFTKVIRVSNVDKLGDKIVVQGGTFQNDAVLAAFEQYVEDVDYRVVGGSLPVTDRVMNDCFWIGVYPGMTREKLQYMIDTIRQFVAEKTACR